MTDDRLDEMFRLQREFQERLPGYRGMAYPPTSPEVIVREVMVMGYSAICEITEAVDEVGWKPWATSRHVNRAAYLAELADAWAFLMNLCLLVGATPDELYEAYLKKVETNHRRQDEKYDGVSSKCPSCKRAYDDERTWCHPAKGDNATAWCQDAGSLRGTPSWNQPTQALPVVSE